MGGFYTNIFSSPVFIAKYFLQQAGQLFFVEHLQEPGIK